MNGTSGSASDRRSWSTTANGLSLILQELMSAFGPEIFLANSHQLRKLFVEADIYPAQDFEHLCSPEHPDAFITYSWIAGVGDVQNAVWGAMDHAGSIMHEQGLVDDPEPIIGGEVRIWIDWIFIDQNARDLASELSVLPSIIDSCDVHYVLSDTALARAWCCWEIAQFNRRFEDDSAVPRSLMAPQPRYEGWERIEAFDKEDKLRLEVDIATNLQGGMAAFEMMMLIASEVSNISMSSANPSVLFDPSGVVMAQTGHAMENLKRAIERWVQRSAIR